jgi:hypothetical protein
MAASKQHGEVDSKKEQGATPSAAFTPSPELGSLIGALGGIQDAIGNSNLALRTLLGGRQPIGPVNASLNTYFARLQRRSLPRGSFRFQSSSSFSNSSGS